ncbi:metallophosphoesterase [Corynebacterium choanae]|uniref:Phosphodiesterase YaeI n=1 Tax=Corynebacterium choanae TaxID=1862358 RepID=A0A3G6J8Z0_9CORY|nr:metallophosphoesterase [Corynebacterium choanae]AZA14581.1 phosphodiesterase YaeI [Corynebacterium choanae]
MTRASRQQSSPLQSATRWVATAVTAATTVGAVAAYANRQATQYSLREIAIACLRPGSLRGKDSFTVLHLSDLHMTPDDEEKTTWLRSLAENDIDLVVNTGDNLGDHYAVPATLRALSPLLNKPGVFVFGNNDYFGPQPVNPLRYLVGKKQPLSSETMPYQGLRAGFLERGWVDLNNACADFAVNKVKLTVAGVDDPHTGQAVLDQDTHTPNPDADVAIALSHSPEPNVLRHFAAQGFDLLCAGHTHGGQLCLPGGRPLVSNCGLPAGRARGLSYQRDMAVHVSPGVGTSKYMQFRLNCPPEATLLHLIER